MDPDELTAALSLLALPQAGAATITRLVDAAGTPRKALRLPFDRVQALRLRPATLQAYVALGGCISADAARQRDWLLENEVQVIARSDPEYPPLLREIPRPPPFLFLRGSADLIGLPQVALVGSRSPTPAGREFAAELAAALVGYGLAVSSGLARGIDTAAHAGVLAARGRTVAVMGTGPDRIYPAANRQLARRILDTGGALLTEYPPGAAPDAAHFPQRNRIISGLGLGVVVVEAALPSGSLLSAQHAAEQGREVMAVPGPVRSATSRGCHELLRNGAALIETAEDVIRALGDRFKPSALPATCASTPTPFDAAALNDDERRLFEATSMEPYSVDRLVERTGLGAARVSAALVRLELAGLIETSAGGVARLR